ncbi:MAG: GNAT family N-acetyltransferase [Rikenellaceae bacterium]
MSNLVSLRAMEVEDLDTLYQYENDKKVWRVSGTTVPFSRHILRKFIDTAFTDIYQSGQLRLIIEREGLAIGAVDIFDFDAHNKRAGVGIIIFDSNNRSKGSAFEAMSLLVDYCFSTLLLHQIYCNIGSHNQASLALFKKLGFQIIGIKKEWNKTCNGYEDELMLQLITCKHTLQLSL